MMMMMMKRELIVKTVLKKTRTRHRAEEDDDETKVVQKTRDAETKAKCEDNVKQRRPRDRYNDDEMNKRAAGCCIKK